MNFLTLGELSDLKPSEKFRTFRLTYEEPLAGFLPSLVWQKPFTAYRNI